jgi:hypothetical protein
MKVIVSDTTSLIVLEGLQRLSLLCEVFEQVLIPGAVLDEWQRGSPDVNFPPAAAGCIEIVRPQSSEQLDHLHLVLDAGEAEAIALALERKLPLLIDERKGRRIAQQKQLIVTGFAGLLLLTVKKDLLSSADARQLLDQAVANGLRLSEPLYQQVCSALADNPP